MKKDFPKRCKDCNFCSYSDMVYGFDVIKAGYCKLSSRNVKDINKKAKFCGLEETLIKVIERGD